MKMCWVSDFYIFFLSLSLCYVDEDVLGFRFLHFFFSLSAVLMKMRWVSDFYIFFCLSLCCVDEDVLGG